MKRKRHTPEQIIAKLREPEAILGAGRSVGQVKPKCDDCKGGECSVAIVPAPGHTGLPKCIGVWAPNDEDNDDTNTTDKLPTIRAMGSDATGTCSWEIVEGAGRVRFVHPDTGALAPSDALDDVKIRVKHTAADGAECEDMIELTVILATLKHSPCSPGVGKFISRHPQ